jgi:RHS repeat-associated protein
LNRLTKRSGLDPGFAYLDNRYCDPTVGAFLTVDPLVATTRTPYLYANGNPTTLTDPSGLCPTFGVSADGKHGGSYDDGKGPCGVKHGSFEVPGRFQNKQFTSVSVPIDAPGLRLYGKVTIDLFISASQAGLVGAHDEGNDRDFYRGAPPSASKVQIHLDFVNGVATAVAAPTCDKNGAGCHDARAWQVVTSASEAIDAKMNNIFINSDNDEIRVQVRGKNSRRVSIVGLDVPSIDRVYRLDVGGTFAWSGDLFPSQDIYGTDYFGHPYQVDRFSEQVDSLGMPELMVDDWSSLQGQLQLR